MNLYIQIKNGPPFQHPIVEANLLEAFPGLDLRNLPVWLARFERVEQYKRPVLSVYGKEIKEVYYFKADGVVTERFEETPLSTEEKIAKQDLEKSRWADLDPPGPASWTFNPTTCVYEAPVPYPEDGLDYFWDEDKKEWIRMTAQCTSD